MTKLDLVILREMAENRPPTLGFEPKTVIALLDRINELEHEIASYQMHGPTCNAENCEAFVQ